jgi:hypothetical protein
MDAENFPSDTEDIFPLGTQFSIIHSDDGLLSLFINRRPVFSRIA